MTLFDAFLNNEKFKLTVFISTINEQNEVKFCNLFVLDIDVADLIRAVITVGRSSIEDVIAFRQDSTFEILNRASTLFSNLTLDTSPNSQGRLKWSMAYNHLDPSEKSGVSYLCGMAVNKLLAEYLHQVPFLMHVDVYKKTNVYNRITPLIRPYLRTNRSPDLVGMNLQGAWGVYESKGRSKNRPSDKDLVRAKEQADSLYQINGLVPFDNVVSATYFDEYMSCHWLINDCSAIVHPSANSINGTYPHHRAKFSKHHLTTIKFLRESLLTDYYAPITQLFLNNATSPQSKEEGYVVTQFPYFRMEILLNEVVFDNLSSILKDKEPVDLGSEQFEKIIEDLGNKYPNKNERHDAKIGLDGILVRPMKK